MNQSKGNSKSNKDTKILKIRITEDEDSYIKTIIEKEHITKQHFAETRLFDTPNRCNEHFDMIARRYPKYCNMVNQIEDEAIRQGLFNFMDELMKVIKE